MPTILNKRSYAFGAVLNKVETAPMSAWIVPLVNGVTDPNTVDSRRGAAPLGPGRGGPVRPGHVTAPLLAGASG